MLLGVTPFLIYVLLLCGMGPSYTSLMKTLKLIFFIVFMILFPFSIMCVLLYNTIITGLLGVLIVGVYFVYIISALCLFFYVFQYLLLLYDIRLVIIGILPLTFIFIKITMFGVLSLIFLYVIILSLLSYL
jgi:hypothetical protein